MHEATRTLSYDGVFVYQRGDQLESMRLIHRYADDVESERLISLSGPAREVIRNGTTVTCLSADDSGAAPDKNPPRDIIGIGFSAPVEKLRGSYVFAVEGQDRVAGRNAMVVTVTPRAPDRYGYRLWLDDETKLLLKSAILNGDGKSLEQVQFTQIEVNGDIGAERLLPGLKGASFSWRTDDDGDIDDPRDEAPAAPEWQAAWLPPGFEFKESSLQQMEDKRGPVNHLVYSDGLAMVSVFVEAVDDEKRALRGQSSRGAVNAFSRLDDMHQITVVGEVPLLTVKRIATSVAKTND
ncbi:MAG: MucB/RseB C-terminal domain-containing protein [Gammaproteobacteria bacterium]|nr:MucB/RseB C-terminal domain-containing protein [Gammaproteobacteria bacterium]